MSQDALQLYDEYFVERRFERKELFQLLAQNYAVERALYPGSFVHITPSFVYPITVYVDTDKRAAAFFADERVYAFVACRKCYPQEACITFYGQDYREPFNEPEEHFDLLISQYAGFVSQHCKRYLRIGGILLANNSHGDASLASIDPDYRLSAVVQGGQGAYRLSTGDLDDYFVPKSPAIITREHLTRIHHGVAYKKSAAMYIFTRISPECPS